MNKKTVLIPVFLLMCFCIILLCSCGKNEGNAINEETVTADNADEMIEALKYKDLDQLLRSEWELIYHCTDDRLIDNGIPSTIRFYFWEPYLQILFDHLSLLENRERDFSLPSFSIDLYLDLLAVANRGGSGDRSDGLGYLALFSDDTAYVALGDLDVIDSDALSVGLVHIDNDGFLVLDEAPGQNFEQFLHYSITPFFLSSTFTVSVGWAPLAIHCFTLSSSTLKTVGFLVGS